MYDMCRYEAAWQPHLVSVWCAAFDDSDLQVREALEANLEDMRFPGLDSEDDF